MTETRFLKELSGPPLVLVLNCLGRKKKKVLIGVGNQRQSKACSSLRICTVDSAGTSGRLGVIAVLTLSNCRGGVCEL